MSQQENNGVSASQFLDIATLLGLASALIYAAGWTYAYYYFGHFQLGLLSLEIPSQYYFMYGFWVFRDAWWLALLYLVLVLPWLLPTAWGRIYLAPYWVIAGRRLLPVVLLLTFAMVHYLALATANQHYEWQRATDFPAYPPVRVWLKPVQSDNKGLLLLTQALPQGCYRLLLQKGNNDTLFLFQPPPINQKVSQLAVVQVARLDVAALRLLPQSGGCGG